MMFNLSTILVLLTIVAAPNAKANHLEARDLSPRHENTLNSRHFRKSRLLPEIPGKRSHLRRRNCPAPSSTSASSDNTTTLASASLTDEDTSPTDAPPESPAPSAETSSSQDAPVPDSPATDAPANNSDSSIQSYLDMHNNERSNHGAAALTWADDLAGVAQSWANGCIFKHSGGPDGENLAAGSGTSVTPSGAIQMWINEAPNYNPSDPQASHWTQVVWKGSSEVGCAVQTCSGESIFGTSSYGDTAQFYVCEYRPAGNVDGQFAENVQV